MEIFLRVRGKGSEVLSIHQKVILSGMLLIFFALGYGKAEGADWKLIEESKGRFYYYDTESIQAVSEEGNRENDANTVLGPYNPSMEKAQANGEGFQHRKVWLKFTANDEDRKKRQEIEYRNGGDKDFSKWDYLTMLVEYKCRNQMYHIILGNYHGDGLVFYSFEDRNGQISTWRDIPPNSVWVSIIEIVCTDQ